VKDHEFHPDLLLPAEIRAGMDIILMLENIFILKFFIIEQRGLMGSIPASYSGGSHFRFKLGDHTF
jgi:hypothetical protein